MERLFVKIYGPRTGRCVEGTVTSRRNAGTTKKLAIFEGFLSDFWAKNER